MQKKLLHKLWKQLPGLYLLLSRDFNCVAVSNNFLDLLGESESSLTNKNIVTFFRDTIHVSFPGGIDTLNKHLEAVRDYEKTGKHTISISSAEKELSNPVPYELSYLPIYDEDHQVEFILLQGEELSQTQSSNNDKKFKHHYETLLETSAQMIWTTNAKGEVEEYSYSWSAFTGQPYEAYRGNGWQNVIHPDDLDKTISLWHKSLETGNPFKATYRVKHISGKWSWTIARAIALHNDQDVHKWLGMNIVLSDLGQAEQIVDEIQIYRNITAHLPFGAAFVVDQDLRYILADGLALKQLGIKSTDLEGKTIEEALGKNLADKFEPYYRKALAGQPFMHEHSNHGHHYVSHGTPLRDDQDEINAVLVVSYDITERKKYEEELNQGKEEFKAHFHQKIVGNAQADASTGRILLVNQKLCELTGYEEHELTERKIWELAEPNDHKEHQKLFKKLVHGELSSIELEKKITNKNGKTLWILLSANVSQHDSNGKALKIGAIFLDISERKDAEKAQHETFEVLEKQAKEFETVLTTVEDGIFIVDRKMRFRYCNQKSLNFLGKRKIEDVLGKKLHETGAAVGVVKALHESYETVFNSKKPSTKTTTYTNVAGKTFCLEHLLVPVLSTEGKVESIVGSTRDITERRLIEETVRRSEKELAAIFSKAAVGLSEISLEGKLLKVNDEICHILDRPREELLTMSLKEITHPEDLPHSLSAFEKLMNSNESISLDKRYVKPDGTIVWANSSITRLDDAQGRPASVLAVTVDLTERTEAEQALRKSEQRLEYEVMVLNDLHQMTMEVLETQSIQEALDKIQQTTISMLNADYGIIQLFNSEKNRLEVAVQYGFEEDFLEKLKSVSIQKNTSFNRAFRSGKRSTIEDVEKDESYREFKNAALIAGYRSAQSTPLISRNGDVIGVLSTYYRVAGKLSDRSEKLLDLLTRQIADLIDNRETEVALRHAKEEAEIAARAKEDFLAHMSHEIRTPLNAVLGLSNLMLKQNKQAEIAENLQTLKFSAENLKILVNDILDFSKIQAGKVSVDESNVKIKEFMSSLYNAHQPHATEKNNELKFELDEKVPEVICTDQLKLSQVMHNLLGNAIKFTKNGSVKVEVKLNKQKRNKYWIDFSVSDNGIGIAKDKLQTIFDAFTQADNSTVRQYGGTGLGLSITKLLLDMMGSKVEVESTQGEGSRFFFTLAVKKGDAAIAEVEEHSQPTEADGEFPNINILLTEDEAINRMVVKQFLSDWWQIVPDEATDGKEAVEMAQSTHYDMILMDVRMPNMDGYQATQLIRELEDGYYKKLPIIALTADTPQEVQKHPLAHLFTDIVTKPFDPQDLREKILEYISFTNTIAKPSAKALKLNTKNVKKIFQDDAKMTQNFYNKAIQSFTNFQHEYEQLMAQRDKKALSDSSHKLKMVLKILALHELEDWLDHSRIQLESESSPAQLDHTIQQGKEIISRVIYSLEQQYQRIGHA